MPKINSKTPMSLSVPMPPDEEIAVIVIKLRENFAWLNSTLNEATSALRLLNHLEQATLAKAFRGELVPQDINDESASVLLERIREARAEESNGGRRKKKE
jgi:type I restriction enzyme S subunit